MVIAACASARAQDGTYSITDGAGAGSTVNALGGAVNSPPTIGNLQSDHAPACPGTGFHYHGLLNGVADPDPLGCGWGHVSPFSMSSPVIPDAPGTAFVRTPRGATVVIPASPGFTPRDSRDVLALSQVSPPLLVMMPSRAWKGAVDFVKLDATHASKHSPRPARRAAAVTFAPRKRTSGAPVISFMKFSLTGAAAKLVDQPSTHTKP